MSILDHSNETHTIPQNILEHIPISGRFRLCVVCRKRWCVGWHATLEHDILVHRTLPRRIIVHVCLREACRGIRSAGRWLQRYQRQRTWGAVPAGKVLAGKPTKPIGKHEGKGSLRRTGRPVYVLPTRTTRGSTIRTAGTWSRLEKLITGGIGTVVVAVPRAEASYKVDALRPRSGLWGAGDILPLRPHRGPALEGPMAHALPRLVPASVHLQTASEALPVRAGTRGSFFVPGRRVSWRPRLSCQSWSTQDVVVRPCIYQRTIVVSTWLNLLHAPECYRAGWLETGTCLVAMSTCSEISSVEVCRSPSFLI